MTAVSVEEDAARTQAHAAINAVLSSVDREDICRVTSGPFTHWQFGSGDDGLVCLYIAPNSSSPWFTGDDANIVICAKSGSGVTRTQDRPYDFPLAFACEIGKVWELDCIEDEHCAFTAGPDGLTLMLNGKADASASDSDSGSPYFDLHTCIPARPEYSFEARSVCWALEAAGHLEGDWNNAASVLECVQQGLDKACAEKTVSERGCKRSRPE